MPDFVSLSCPSCGAKLQVTRDLERFACGFCGNELTVRRGGGIISLAPVVEGLERVATGVTRVQQGVDRTASELAIQRLRRDQDELTAAWGVVDSRESAGSRLGTAALVIGVVAVSGGSTSFGVISILIGIALLWAYFAQERAKKLEKSAIEKKVNGIVGEIDFHRLNLR